MKNKRKIAALFAGGWAFGMVSLGGIPLTYAAETTERYEILYPEYMQESEGESLVLDQKPEKIVCLSNSALQILIRCNMQPIAVTSPASTIDYPDWVSELPVIETGMSELDSESVIAMEPDLVIMGVHLQEDYGPILESAGIQPGDKIAVCGRTRSSCTWRIIWRR